MIMKFSGIQYETISKAEYDNVNTKEERDILKVVIWDGTYYFKRVNMRIKSGGEK